jgi:hypothetical protein
MKNRFNCQTQAQASGSTISSTKQTTSHFEDIFVSRGNCRDTQSGAEEISVGRLPFRSRFSVLKIPEFFLLAHARFSAEGTAEEKPAGNGTLGQKSSNPFFFSLWLLPVSSSI